VGWQLRAHWHWGRPDDVAINEFAHDRCTARGSDYSERVGRAGKADLQAVPEMAKAAVDSIKGSMAAQNEAARKRLAEAVTYLEATGKHAADGVRSSGKEFQTAVRQTIADARAAVQKVSEVVAANRTAGSAQSARK
jgi:hypothetical protein